MAVYWALLTIGPLLVGISLSIFAYGLAQNTDYFFSSSLHFVGNVLGNAAFLFLLYRLVPNCHVPLLHVLTGSLITGVLLETAKYGFGIYISHFNSYAPVYGAFSIIPIFLIWLNLLWLIVLSGALLIACMGDWHSWQEEIQQPDHVFNQVIAILLLLAEAQQQGETITIRTIRQKLAIDRGQIETLLLRLAKCNMWPKANPAGCSKPAPNKFGCPTCSAILFTATTPCRTTRCSTSASPNAANHCTSISRNFIGSNDTACRLLLEYLKA